MAAPIQNSIGSRLATSPRPLVVAGPSGVGKGTLLSRLRAAFPDAFGFSVSYTSRKRRPGEENGKEYFFVDSATFLKGISENQFIEYAENYGNYYGTALSEVERIQKSEKICLLEVDLNGVRQIMNSEMGKYTNFIFIRPVSIEALTTRLRGRGTEKESEISLRISIAEKELNEASTMPFHRVLVNDELEKCYQDLQKQILYWYPFLRNQTQPHTNSADVGVEKNLSSDSLIEEILCEHEDHK